MAKDGKKTDLKGLKSLSKALKTQKPDPKPKSQPAKPQKPAKTPKPSGKAAPDPDKRVWQAVKNSVSPLELGTRKTFRGIVNAADRIPQALNPDDKAEARKAATSSARFVVAPDELLKHRQPALQGLTSKKELAPGQLDGLDRKRGERLRKGKLQIDGRLDLHGMTRDRARSVVSSFLANAQSSGKRTVIIITGKGYSHDQGGVLRTELPRWLNMSPNRERVLAYDFAQPKDGGQGAYYVYIKKIRDRT